MQRLLQCDAEAMQPQGCFCVIMSCPGGGGGGQRHEARVVCFLSSETTNPCVIRLG